MTCKNCGEQIPESIMICPKCGTDNGEATEILQERLEETGDDRIRLQPDKLPKPVEESTDTSYDV